MLKFCALAAACLAVALPELYAAEPAAPKLDKAQIAAYLRYAEGFTSAVHFVIDDPQPSPFPGFYRVNVHLTNDAGGKLDRMYYVAPDGKHFVNGAIWALNRSPFEDTLGHLPKDGYSFGPASAKVNVVIFSDFQCPFCKEFAKTVRDNLPQKYPNDVRVTFADFPIESLHPWAQAAAEASHCVADRTLGDQKSNDIFWAFHDWIFEHQGEVKRENLKEKVLGFAKEKGLDVSKVESCMETHASAALVNKDIEAGKQVQVQQTPTVFVNGRLIPGAMPWKGLDSVIQLELDHLKGLKEDRPAVAEKCCEVAMPAVGKR